MMQGRIYPADMGSYQLFPLEEWREEIVSAMTLGYDGLELLYDRKGVLKGLFVLGEIERDVVYASLCADSLAHVDVRDGHAFRAELGSVLELCDELLIGKIIIPFVELNEPPDAGVLRGHLKGLASILGDRMEHVVIESNLPAPDFSEAVEGLGCRVCYDLGNATAAGRPVAEEIRALGDRIGHVHIKDRLHGGANVPLGEGALDFVGAARALSEIGYCGDFTFETAYGEDSLESAKEHLRVANSYLREVGL